MAANEETLRIIAKLVDEVSGTAKKINRELKKTGEASGAAAKKSSKQWEKANKTFGTTAKQITAVGVAMVAIRQAQRIFSSAWDSAMDFGKAMSEVSTLVDEQAVSMDGLSESVSRIAVEYGQAESVVARGLYQAISSGAEAGAESLNVLEVSTQLAVAGVTDVATATDLVTSSINAYRGANLQAAEASDVLFKTVQLGKTTIGELAGSLGQVLPLSASLGISFEEVNAALATLTLGGLSTAEASTALRATLSSMLNVTGDGEKILKRAGVSFDEAAVNAKGLAGILADVEREFGGNNQALQELFPNVRGLTAVLSLLSDGGAKLNETLLDIEDSAGAAGEALQKQLDDPTFKATQTVNAFKIALREAGSVMVNEFAASFDAMGAANENMVAVEQTMQGIEAIAVVLAKTVQGLAAAFWALVAVVRTFVAQGSLLANTLGLVSDAQQKALADSASAAAATSKAFANAALGIEDSADAISDALETQGETAGEHWRRTVETWREEQRVAKEREKQTQAYISQLGELIGLEERLFAKRLGNASGAALPADPALFGLPSTPDAPTEQSPTGNTSSETNAHIQAMRELAAAERQRMELRRELLPLQDQAIQRLRDEAKLARVALDVRRENGDISESLAADVQAARDAALEAEIQALTSKREQEQRNAEAKKFELELESAVADELLAKNQLIADAVFQGTMNVSEASAAMQANNELAEIQLLLRKDQLTTEESLKLIQLEISQEQKDANAKRRDDDAKRNDLLREYATELDLAHNASNLLARSIVDVATGAKSGKEAFSDFASSFALQIAEMIAKAAALQIVLAALGGRGTNLGGLFADAVGLSGSGSHGGVGRDGEFDSFATGGVPRSGRQLVEINEGPFKTEGILPLAEAQMNGRRVLGVAASGGGGESGTTLNVSIQAIDTASFVSLASQDPEGLANIIVTAAESDPYIRSALGVEGSAR